MRSHHSITRLAVLLTASAVALPAFATNLNIGGEGGVDIDIPDLDLEGAVEGAVDLGPDNEEDDDGDGDEAQDTVTLESEAGGEVTLETSTLIGANVSSSDGIEFGTIMDVATAADGEAVFVIAVDDEFVEGGGTIALRASAFRQNEEGEVESKNDSEAVQRYAQNNGGAANAGNADGQASSDPFVCFFSEWDFAGSYLCIAAGAAAPQMPQGWDDAVSSIRIDTGAELRACRDPNYGGWCEIYTESVNRLTGDRNDAISSYQTSTR